RVRSRDPRHPGTARSRDRAQSRRARRVRGGRARGDDGGARVSAVSIGTPLSQIVDEARRLATAALERDVPIRLVGGLAVRIRVDDAFHPGLSREYQDIDFVTIKGRSKVVARFLEDMGYEPNQAFNAMNGHERLLFNDACNERQVDVFVGA